MSIFRLPHGRRSGFFGWPAKLGFKTLRPIGNLVLYRYVRCSLTLKYMLIEKTKKHRFNAGVTSGFSNPNLKMNVISYSFIWFGL